LTRLVVDGLQFDFEGSWRVEKWDDSPWYRDSIQRLQGDLDGRHEGTKAVDLLGLQEEVPYLIEVKDFRGFTIENKRRQIRELPLEIGLKARDTLAGVAGLVSLGNPPELPARWLRAVRDRARSVHVVAWIAEDSTRSMRPVDQRARAEVRLSGLKQKLAWLTRRVWVCDPLKQITLGDVSATSLAGAGVARQP
jgi:hypothetical protein